MKYIYNNITNSPNLQYIHLEITESGSTMENKSIEWCRWDEDPSTLQINFENELSSSDKTKLDLIIEGI